jgi:hypothetical protein
MALAATGHEDIARDVSTAAAMELRQAGINWAYSPVADVNSDARNPVIGLSPSIMTFTCAMLMLVPTQAFARSVTVRQAQPYCSDMF